MIGEEGNLVKLINNPIKQYEWGSPHQDSFVAKLSSKNNCSKFAQMWMGIHVRGQSNVSYSNNKSIASQNILKLSQYLQLRHAKPIQFMFKVLSIDKCLSIQVHPNKQQALQLHNEKPDIYADSNDKPEMFYTLSEFQCFIGYIKQQEFQRITKLQLFHNFFKQISAANPKDMIIQILKLSLNAQTALVEESIKNIEHVHPSRYGEHNKNAKIWKILTDFPNDIGIVISFFMEYKLLPAGVCYYIESNVPHAYIHGECLQIMKNSDNVCRLGLTPKFKDLLIISKVLGGPLEPILKNLPVTVQKNGFIYELYHTKGLYFLVIKQTQQSNIKSQTQIEPISQYRICLMIQGEYLISEEWEKQNNENVQEKKNVGSNQDRVYLLKPNLKYKLRRVGQTGGTICIGWSQF